MVQRRKQAAKNQWMLTDVPWQLRQQLRKERHRDYQFPVPTSMPLISEPICLYVFSGRRRDGDYESHVMQKLGSRSLPGRVLLLDLALSPSHNVYEKSLVETLLTWFRSGAIAGLLIAPPCETWSEVRWELTEEPNAPRPLRTSEDPLCLPALTNAEVAHLEVSNYLLFVAIRLFLAAICSSTPALFEHPKQPKDTTRASVWALPWLQAMFASGYANRELLWQAQYRAQPPKPTHLGVAHLPSFRRAAKAYQLPTDWKNLKTLKGKSASGEWLTSAGKE